MKVVAIWERPQAHARWGGTFVLLDSGEFLELTQEREYLGTDAQGERQYHETGNPNWGFSFEDKLYDFESANRLIRHFGGVLLWYQGDMVFSGLVYVSFLHPSLGRYNMAGFQRITYHGSIARLEMCDRSTLEVGVQFMLRHGANYREAVARIDRLNRELDTQGAGVLA